MTDYPFYDVLLKDLKEKDLTHKQKITLISKIDKLDNNGMELIYAIIKVHYLRNNDTSSFKLPYDGIYVNNESVKFDLEKLPYLLKQIINKFVKLHMQKIKEDKKRKKE